MKNLMCIVLIMFATSAYASESAVCGDFNNDGKVTATDALKVLRSAVGLGKLTCAIDDDKHLINMDSIVVCSSGSNYTSTWSGSNKVWDITPHGLPLLSQDYLEVNQNVITGVFTATFGDCGTAVFDMDAIGISYDLTTAVKFWWLYSAPYIYLNASVTPEQASSNNMTVEELEEDSILLGWTELQDY